MSLFKSNLFKNMSLLGISQVFALLVSAVLILILPRLIPMSDYGYWQLFLLYAGYVGVFHFGYSDGLYISFGGKDLKNLHGSQLRAQFAVFLIFQLLISLALIFFSFSWFSNVNKRWVFVGVSVFLIIENYHKLLSFLLLATNNAATYAKSVIIDKILIVVFLFILLAAQQLSLTNLLFIYIVCRLASLIYLIVLYPKFIPQVTDTAKFGPAFSQILALCKIGIILTFSNIFGIFILASGRLVVEHFWSINSFAQISLAVSLAFFIMSFISQLSLILFPILCNAETSIQKKILRDGSLLIGFISVLGFGFYFLTHFFIKWWLPSYNESLAYLIYLFPIILFENKTQILYTTYCKSQNKLGLLMKVNLLVLFIALAMYFVAAQIHSIEFVLVTMFFALMLRSLILHFYLFRYFKLKTEKYFYIEIALSVAFILVYKLFGFWISGIFFLLAVVGYSLMALKDLKSIYFIFKDLKK